MAEKLIVSTVDTVLGLIQNNRKPCGILFRDHAICLVSDEVHAYDD